MIFDAVGRATGEMIAELRKQLEAREAEVKSYLQESRELRLEVVKLATIVAEMRGLPPLDTPSNNTRKRAN